MKLFQHDRAAPALSELCGIKTFLLVPFFIMSGAACMSACANWYVQNKKILMKDLTFPHIYVSGFTCSVSLFFPPCVQQHSVCEAALRSSAPPELIED